MNNMPTRRNLGEIFSLLRTTPTARPAYTAEEIREIVAGGRTEAPPRSGRRLPAGRTLMFMAMTTIISGALISHITIRSGSPAGTEAKFARAGAAQYSIPLLPPAASDDTAQADGKNRRKKNPGKKRTLAAPKYQSSAAAPARPDMVQVPSTMMKSAMGLPPSESMRSIPVRPERISSMEERPQYIPAPRTIPGALLIELKPEELERINVKRTTDGLELMVEDRYAITNLRMAEGMADLGYDTTRKQGTRRLQVSIGARSLEVQIAPPAATELSLPFNPFMISLTDAGVRPPAERGSVLYFFNDSLFQDMRDEARRNIAKELSEQNSGGNYLLGNKEAADRSSALRNLLPVHIRLAPSADAADRNGSDIYLWYRPTEAFISALPERYRVALQKELELMAQAQEMKLGIDEICRQGTTQRSFFDYCRQGAIVKAEIVPNPAQGETFCRITVDRPRTISMAIYDLNGNFVKDLSGPAPYPVGDHEVTCNLENIPHGTYLILIRTELGEQMVRHLINR